MKKILSLFVLLVVLCAMQGVQARIYVPDDKTTAADTDSLVNVIGWFGKTDTLEYMLISRVAEVNGTDTTLTEFTTDKFTIRVTDESKHGYEMEYVLDDVTIDDSTSLQAQMRLELARMGIGTKVVFTTNEMGVLGRIKNSKQIYNNSLRLQKEYAARLYERNPLLVGKISRQDLLKKWKEQLDEIFSSDEKLMKNYVGLGVLFANHGKAFPLNVTQTEKDGAKITLLATKGKLEGEEDSSEDEFQVYYNIVQTTDSGTTIYDYDYSYFDDGWVREALVTIKEGDDNKQTITQLELTWLSKAW